MYVVAVTIFVKPEFIEAFRAATLDNCRNSRLEPDNLRFDLLQSEDDPGRFFLYEAYKSKQGFADHQATAHFLRWKPKSPTGWQPRKPRSITACFLGMSEGSGVWS